MIRIKVDEPDVESVAVAALAYLADDEERLDRFVAVTGVDPGGIRLAASDAGFLAAVLDHVMGDDALVLGLAGRHGWPPETVARAHHRLSGG